MGLSKDRPSIVSAVESVLRGASGWGVSALPRAPSGWESRFPSAFRPRGFAPPRRFVPPRPCGPIAGRCRSWGSSRFLPSRNGIPRDALAALRSLPSADSYVPPRRIPDSRGPASPPRPFPAGAFTANLAPSPFSLSSLRDRGFPRRLGREPGPRGLAPSSGPLRARPFPAEHARCSPGLGRLTVSAACQPGSSRTGRRNRAGLLAR